MGLANQSCVRGLLCLDSTALRCVARIITLSLSSSFRLGFFQYYLSRNCNDYTGFQPLSVRCQSCFSLGSKTVYVLSSLLKSMAHASEFRSLFRGATQKQLRNGLRAISCACGSRLRCINSVDDPIARYGDYELMTVNCTVNLCGI